jgi:hypothetical protein
LTQTWSDQHKETVRAYSDMFKQNTDVVFKKCSMALTRLCASC